MSVAFCGTHTCTCIRQTKYLKGSDLGKMMPPEVLNIVIHFKNKFSIMEMVPQDIYRRLLTRLVNHGSSAVCNNCSLWMVQLALFSHDALIPRNRQNHPKIGHLTSTKIRCCCFYKKIKIIVSFTLKCFRNWGGGGGRGTQLHATSF